MTTRSAPNKNIFRIALVFVVLLLLNSTTYVVNETEQVIVTQFGEPVGKPVLTPGLHFKVPLVQKANYFDKRFLEWDGDPNQVPTKDKRFIWVDTYARWRISDPLKFFQRLRDERGAQSRLDDIVDGETRSAVARHDLVEVVRSSNREAAAPETGSEEETVLEKIQTGRQAIAARTRGGFTTVEQGHRWGRPARDVRGRTRGSAMLRFSKPRNGCLDCLSAGDARDFRTTD